MITLSTVNVTWVDCKRATEICTVVELNSPHEHAKREMKRKGWSYRRAARQIGKGYPWVAAVLNGRGTSQPVIDAILALPLSPTPYSPLGFARKGRHEQH